MEAAIRRTSQDLKSTKASEKEAAAVKFNDACAQILPEMPKLMDICRPEEQKLLLVSHICMLLVEYAATNSSTRVPVDSAGLCRALRRTIESSELMDTTKYC